MARHRHRLVEGVAALAVAAAKLALVHGRLLCPRPLPHDDLLFARLASSILDTGWLGPYNQLTLVKGPFLPIFLAATAPLHIPFLVGQDVLYLLAAGAVVLALGPVVPSPTARILLLAFVAFNPATLSRDSAIYGVWGPVLTREPLYASLTLLVMAALIAMWTYRERSRRIRLAWSLCLGLSLAPLWLTREEGVWLVPSLVLAYVASAWWLARHVRARRERSREAVLLAVPLGLLAGAVALVCALNWWHYGLFTTNELLTRPFRAAYGALTRVHHPARIPHLPVPRAVRERIYAVSPTFRELQAPLEDHGTGWFDHGCPIYPQTCGDLTGGWFLWAFRDAVSRTGHHSSATDAAAYYLRLAGEVNEACADGRLDCDPLRETLIDPIRWYHLQPIPRAMAVAAARTLAFSDVQIATEACKVPEAAVTRVYERVTGQRFPAPTGPPAGAAVTISSWILTIYRWAVPALAALAGIGYVASLLALARSRDLSIALPSTLIILAVGARLALFAVADVLASVPYSPRHYQPVFALQLVFIGVAIYGVLPLAAKATAAARRSARRDSQHAG